MELYLENGTGLFMKVGDRAAERWTKRGCIVLEEWMEKTERAKSCRTGGQSPRLRKKLEDYDYLIQHFFTIHPTASIDRSLMNAETFFYQMDRQSEGRGDEC